MIAAMLKGVEEEFAGVAVDPFKGPSTAVVVPVSSHPQRQATIVETIVHRANQQTIFRIFREFPLYREKVVFKILSILSVVIGQMVNIGTSIYRIEINFFRLRESG